MAIQIAVPRTIVEQVLRISGRGAGGAGIAQAGVDQSFDDSLSTLVSPPRTAGTAHDERPQRPAGAQRSDLQGDTHRSIRLVGSGEGEFHQAVLLLGGERNASAPDPDHPRIFPQSLRQRGDARPKCLIVTGLQYTQTAIG